MSSIIRTFKFRLYPTPEQSETIGQFAGVCRFIYNLALEQRRDWHRQFKANTGKSITSASQSRELSSLREQVDWIAAPPRCVLEQALRDLDKAYHRFFKGSAGYPTPRRKGENESFRVPAKELGSPIRTCVNPRFGEIKLPKLGWCQFRMTRKLPPQFAIIEVATVRDSLGWQICIALRQPAAESLQLSGSVGIDRGVANTLAFSDGSVASQPIEVMRVLQRRAKAHQRRLSRQKRGSNRRSMTKRLLAKTQAKLGRVRKHWNHEQTTRIAGTYGTVAVEALKTSSMTRSAKGTIGAPGVNVRQKAGLNRSILEHGWHQFERLLAYKLAATGGTLLKVDPSYTSQTCFACGSTSKEHRKSQAVFECTDCGYAAHADTNAALNIKRAGEQPASRGAVRPSVKREPIADKVA